MKCWCYAALLFAAFIPLASAADPWPLFDGQRWTFPKLKTEWSQRSCWCPDDYDRKTLPCVSPNAKGCVDDYNFKPMPCVSPNAKGCVDDYCPKTCPLFLHKPTEPWYSCGTPPAGSGVSTKPIHRVVPWASPKP